jgi:hypothetical protein
MPPSETDNYREADLTQLDDTALLTWRAQARAELERLPPASPGYAALAALYDRSTSEVNDRARKAWPKACERARTGQARDRERTEPRTGQDGRK